MLRTNWTTKRNDIVTIKRGRNEKAVWRNMFGLNPINYDTTRAAASKMWGRANPGRYSWTLRLLDRNAMKTDDAVNGVENEEAPLDVAPDAVTKEVSGGSDGDSVREKESFEVQYMDVVVGVVDAEKMPKKALSDAFHLYACGMCSDSMLCPYLMSVCPTVT